MKKLLVAAALVACIFGATATAALANVSIQGIALDSAGHGTSGATVQLTQLWGASWVLVQTCTSGAGGVFNCGSHVGNHYYKVFATRIVNCVTTYSDPLPPKAWVPEGSGAFSFYPVLNRAVRDQC